MHNFRYVTKQEALPIKRDIITLINLVQNEVRDKFTFAYEFIGSAKRNMITWEPESNIGFDFDVNLKVNDDDEEFTAEQIKQILVAGFNKYVKLFQYDFCEDSRRVITIKVKDRENSKILHSCDFAIVHDYIDEGETCQEYIHFNKKHRSYEWKEQAEGFYNLPQKIEWCKANDLWQQVRERYLEYKNENTDPKRKSRHLFCAAVHSVAQMHGYYN